MGIAAETVAEGDVLLAAIPLAGWQVIPGGW